MQVVNSISCINNAGFVMKFKLQWQKGDRGGHSGWSDEYSNPDSKSLNFNNLKIEEGSEVWIVVHAIWGKTKSANQHVKYSSSADAHATYKVTGGSLTYEISLEGGS
jgi:hypothetical protein